MIIGKEGMEIAFLCPVNSDDYIRAKVYIVYHWYREPEPLLKLG